uniref:Uncharacterized protein n=1 Tax=Oryza brachyantha TaxID=4533 RepID=J3N1F1_ORYBR
MFMTLDNVEERLAWLKMKHEAKLANETDGSDASLKSDSTDVDEDDEFAMEILRHHQAL